jgi:hypothetical protein
MIGVLRERRHHPHVLDSSGLSLRWGRQVVARIAMEDVATCAHRTSYEHSYTLVQEGLLVLTPKALTNVELNLSTAVECSLGKFLGTGKDRATVTRIQLYVEDPAEFLAALAAAR